MTPKSPHPESGSTTPSTAEASPLAQTAEAPARTGASAPLTEPWTPRRIELARHALGLPNTLRKSYRNHFVAGDGHTDFEDWTALVAAGLAKRYEPRALFGGDYCFVLTLDGARAALKRGERLDPQDFPEARYAMTSSPMPKPDSGAPKRRMTLDPKCHDLAKHFLDDVKGANYMDIQELAERLQTECEEFCQEIGRGSHA